MKILFACYNVQLCRQPVDDQVTSPAFVLNTKHPSSTVRNRLATPQTACLRFTLAGRFRACPPHRQCEHRTVSLRGQFCQAQLRQGSSRNWLLGVSLSCIIIMEKLYLIFIQLQRTITKLKALCWHGESSLMILQPMLRSDVKFVYKTCFEAV